MSGRATENNTFEFEAPAIGGLTQTLCGQNALTLPRSLNLYNLGMAVCLSMALWAVIVVFLMDRI